MQPKSTFRTLKSGPLVGFIILVSVGVRSVSQYYNLSYSMVWISSDGSRYQDSTMHKLMNIPASARTYTVKKEVVIVGGGTEKSGAFYQNPCYLTTLTFESGSNLETLENWAGGYCEALVTLDMSQCTLVTDISHGCFALCTALKDVTLPPNLVNMWAASFTYCTEMSKIAIPDSVVNIKRYAAPGGVFHGCVALSEIIVSPQSNLAFIGWHAFTKTAITSFTVTAKVNNIEVDGAFVACNQLKSITVVPENQYYEIVDGFLVNTGDSTMCAYPNAMCTDVTLPEGPTLLGGVFRDNALVTRITLSSTLEEIWGNSMTGCTKLIEVIVPDNSSLRKLHDISIANCYVLTTFRLPKSLEELGGGVFSGCPKLVLTDEEGGSFRTDDDIISQNDVIKLYRGSNSSVVIPDTYVGFSRNSFQNMGQIVHMTVTTRITSLPNEFIWYCGNLLTFTAPGVVVVGAEAFRFCRRLHTVNLGKVTSIGWMAFSECHALVSFNVDLSELEALSYEAFSMCYTLAKFECSSPVLTKICQSCFRDCTALKSITIPPAVTIIESNTFSLSGLEVLRFGGTAITEVGARAFYQCGKLCDIVLSSSITTLSKECFAMCTSLVNMVITAPVEMIGELAFEGCSSLETLKIEGTTPMTLTAGAFISCKNFRDIIIGDHPSFSYEKGIVLYNNDRTEIMIYLAGCTNREFVIPDSVVRVAAHAFDYAVHLETVVIPDSGNIKEIGYRSFHACKGLTRLTIPESVTSVHEEAFLNTDIVKCDSVVYPLRLKDALIAAGIDTRCLQTCPPTELFTMYFSGTSRIKWEMLKCAAGLLFSNFYM